MSLANILGFTLTGAGLYGVFRFARRRTELRRVPRTAIARNSGGPLVHIAGKVVAGEEVLTGPLSGAEAVWLSVVLTDGSGRSAKTVVDETHGRPFYVDDDSGELARVVPDGAIVETWWERSASSPADLKLEGFMGFEGFARAARVSDTCSGSERMLAPGDRVFVMGPARREPIEGTTNHGESQPSRLMFEASGGSRATLLISTRSEQAVAASLGWKMAASAMAAVLGALLLWAKSR